MQSIEDIKLIATYQGSVGLFATLKGHTDRISALRLLKRGSGSDQRDVAILTASGDKSLRIWEMDASMKVFFN